MYKVNAFRRYTWDVDAAKAFPSDVSDEEWEFCVSYPTVYPIILDGTTSICLDSINFQKEFEKLAR